MIVRVQNLFQKHWQILILLLINIIIGLTILDDFGVSFDEPGMVLYSAQVLDAYEGIFRADFSPSFASNYRYYGPAILTSILIFHKFILAFLPEFSQHLSWHLAYFIAFQITIVSLYGISIRFFRKDVAVLVILLFITQPLIITVKAMPIVVNNTINQTSAAIPVRCRVNNVPIMAPKKIIIEFPMTI